MVRYNKNKKIDSNVIVDYFQTVFNVDFDGWHPIDEDVVYIPKEDAKENMAFYALNIFMDDTASISFKVYEEDLRRWMSEG